MREPLELRLTRSDSPHRLCIIQALYMLGLIDESQIKRVRAEFGPAQDAFDSEPSDLRVAFKYGAYLHYVSPGEQHTVLEPVIESWRALGQNEMAISQQAAQLRRILEARSAQITQIRLDFPGRLTYAEKFADHRDLDKLLSRSDGIAELWVRETEAGRGWPTLAFGRQSNACRTYSPILNSKQPWRLNDLAAVVMPVIGFWSRGPI